jgi:methylated-DNA-[protein]-cysteine S-methyltransferase
MQVFEIDIGTPCHRVAAAGSKNYASLPTLTAKPLRALASSRLSPAGVTRVPVHVFVREQLETPTGLVHIITDDQDRLRAVEWDDHGRRMQTLLRRHYGAAGVEFRAATAPSAARIALQAYFAGDIHALAQLPTETNGTAFQCLVWQALCEIPAGETLSYSGLAAKIGRPSATRAVGLANGSNPIPIVVPCHRVIGADGSLTGFGGGMERKRWLLAHEGRGLRVQGELL